MGDVDVKKVRATGSSAINGAWNVEDVVLGEKMLRRLIFLSTRNLIQTEARIISEFKSCCFERKASMA